MPREHRTSQTPALPRIAAVPPDFCASPPVEKVRDGHRVEESRDGNLSRGVVRVDLPLAQPGPDGHLSLRSPEGLGASEAARGEGAIGAVLKEQLRLQKPAARGAARAAVGRDPRRFPAIVQA